MKNSLTELVQQLYGRSHDPISDDFINGIRKNIKKYRLEKVGTRPEVRRIGRDDIPKEGTIIGYEDNEWYKMLPSYLKKFPDELENEKGFAFVVERIDAVYPRGDSVKLWIGKYLVREKSSKSGIKRN